MPMGPWVENMSIKIWRDVNHVLVMFDYQVHATKELYLHHYHEAVISKTKNHVL